VRRAKFAEWPYRQREKHFRSTRIRDGAEVQDVWAVSNRTIR